MKVTTVEEMRSLDRTSMETFGYSENLLMENAGIAVYSVIMEAFEGRIEGRVFTLLCGIGNNGGDGFVVARKLHSNGALVRVYVIGSESKLKGSARENYEILKRLPVEVKNAEEVGLDEIEESIFSSDAIVDAILGTGISREVGGLFREVIELVNRSAKTVFSVDIPSGVNGNTGEVMGTAVRADYTVTFGLPKIGNMLYPGFQLCGELYCSHISFPPSMYDWVKVETNDPMPLPERRKDGHKGSFGKALFVAGSSRYFGAPYFSALSFLKAGGGYARLAAPRSVVPFIASKGSEIVFVPQEETASGSISRASRDAILELSNISDIVVIGPGLSLEDETQELVRELLPAIEKPVVLDGDGITAVSLKPEILRERGGKTALTPHPGEMARLLGLSVKDVEKNRLETVRKASGEFGCVFVLKGAHSLIGYPDGRVFINMTGNSGMATAGSGDVLTGTICAMYGIGFSFEDAVRMGVFVHGLSGDLAAKKKGEDGITAQDILEFLPEAMKLMRENFGVVRDAYEISVI